jgi:hypothetical protein
MSKDDDNLTTEQLMEAALTTVQQMSPEEKAKLRLQMDASVQKMRAALHSVKQLSSEEKATVRTRLRLETVATGTLQEFVEGLELSYRALAPEQRRRWLAEVRKACDRWQRLQKMEGEWIQ